MLRPVARGGCTSVREVDDHPPSLPLPGAGGTRPGVVYLAWTVNRGRVDELSALLGAVPVFVHPRLLRHRRLTPLRYVVSAVLTLAALVRLRPRCVLVINPPVLAAGVVALYGAVSGARVVLDSHPGGFGAQDDALSARLQGLHRWAASRAAAVLVTGEHWGSVVRGWGGTPLVVHEPPAPWTVPASPPPGGAATRVLFLGTYGRDEPVAALVEAARSVPDVQLAITGDVARAPEGLLEAASANVEAVGYLDADAYRRQVLASDVVVVLTTEPTSVMRAAYEAVYARRPLVVSDWPGLRELFPHAVHVTNDAAGIAAGIREAVDRRASLQAVAETARDEQQARWQSQLADLRAVIG